MRKTIGIAGLALVGLCLAGCAGKTPPPEIRIERVTVQVPAPCPAKPVYDELVRSRPTPLRESPMPATKEERVARTAAQLGRYEAEGGWADQVSAALDRCQVDATP